MGQETNGETCGELGVEGVLPVVVCGVLGGVGGVGEACELLRAAVEERLELLLLGPRGVLGDVAMLGRKARDLVAHGLCRAYVLLQHVLARSEARKALLERARGRRRLGVVAAPAAAQLAHVARALHQRPERLLQRLQPLLHAPLLLLQSSHHKVHPSLG